MEIKNKSTKFKVIIAVLITSIFAAFFFIYKLIYDEHNFKKDVISRADIKSKVLVELIQLNSGYNNAIIENSVFSQELVEEREKIIKLMELINNSENETASSKIVTTKIKIFKTRLKYLNELILNLKIVNPELKNQRDSLFFVLQEFEKQNNYFMANSLDSNNVKGNSATIYKKTPSSSSIEKPTINKTINNAKAKILEKLHKINIINLTAQTYYIDENTNNKKKCNKSTNVNQLEIYFIIPENYLTKAGNRDYYIQLYDVQNILKLDNKTIDFGLEKTINYTYKTIIDYNNKLLKVTSNYRLNNLIKGKYFVKIYNDDELINQTSFTLF
jgi:hypothetical protein